MISEYLDLFIYIIQKGRDIVRTNTDFLSNAPRSDMKIKQYICDIKLWGNISTLSSELKLYKDKCNIVVLYQWKMIPAYLYSNKLYIKMIFY